MFLLLGSAGLAIGQTPRLDIPKDASVSLFRAQPASLRTLRASGSDGNLLGASVKDKTPTVGNTDTVELQVGEVFRGRVGPTIAVQVHTHHCAPFVIVDPFEEGAAIR